MGFFGLRNTFFQGLACAGHNAHFVHCRQHPRRRRRPLQQSPSDADQLFAGQLGLRRSDGRHARRPFSHLHDGEYP